MSNFWEVSTLATQAHFYVVRLTVTAVWAVRWSISKSRKVGRSFVWRSSSWDVPQKERGFARCPKGWKQFTIWYVKWQNMSSYILSFWMIIWLAVAEFSTPQAQTNVPATWTWNGKLQGKNLNPDEHPAKCPHLGSFPTWAAACQRLSLLESFHRHLLSVPSRKRANFGEEGKHGRRQENAKGFLSEMLLSFPDFIKLY